MPEWTSAQSAAIKSRDQSLLLAAAAGSGKTAVLIERIVSLLRGGADIRRMLVVTFTRMAAGEMKQRLRSAISQSADESLIKQLGYIEEAPIGTLHSYLSRLLREKFVEARIDPGFRMGEDGEMAVLLRQSADSAIDEALVEADEGARMLELLSGDLDALREMMMRLYRFSRSQPQPEKWLRAAAEPDALWEADFGRDVAAILDTAKKGLAAALLPAEACGAVKSPKIILGDIEVVNGILAALEVGLPELLEALAGAKFATWNGAGGDKALSEEARDARAAALKPLKKLQEDVSASYSDEMEIVKRAAYPARALCELTIRMAEDYRLKKRFKSVLDFDDLEHVALKMLSDVQVSDVVRDGFDYVFVDEYQDISRVQDEILRAVSRATNLFMVGDVKQSIYRFRSAEPGIFLKKHNSFSLEEDAANRRIDLTRNFRSSPNILNCVNQLFAKWMTGATGEIDYSNGHALTPSKAAPVNEPEVTVHIISMDDEELGADPEDAVENETALPEEEEISAEEMTGIERQAQLAALRVEELCGEMIYDASGEGRKLRYEDFAVLLRSSKDKMQAFVQAMLGRGIPVYADSGEPALEIPIIRLAMALLRVVDNPRRDDDLITTLHGPVVGLSAEHLAEIRALHPDRKLSYYDAVCLAETHGGQPGPQLRAFFEKLKRWRHYARTLSAADAVWRIFTDSGLYDAAAAFASGEEAQQSLRAFAAKAQAFAVTPRRSLGDFLRHVDALKRSGNDMDAARAVGDLNAVRVMSIHKSKGLEFPVVLLCDAGKQFNFMDAQGSIVMHRDLGVAMPAVFIQSHEKRTTLKQMAIKRRIKDETVCEELRLLYVAMTRAKLRLEIIASAAKIAVKQDKWKRPDFAFHEARSYLDWVMPLALAQNQLSPAKWRVQRRVVEQAAAVELPTVEPNAPPPQWLESRVNFEYPHMSASRIPRKVSVTGLRDVTDLPPLKPRPRFMETLAPSAAARGVATHLLLRRFNIDALRGLSPNEMQAAVSHALTVAVETGALTPQLAQGVDVIALSGWLCRPLGRRMLAAANVRREAPFEALLPARDIDPAMDSDEPILMQGVLDLCFEEDGAWVLVDFKTDRVAPHEAESAAIERHGKQLSLYARALEAVTSMMVKELHVAFLSAGVDILLP